MEEENEIENELPRGTGQEEEEGEENQDLEASEETPEDAQEEEQSESEPEVEEPIRIGGQLFKTQAEAIAYAENLEREKLLSDAHAQGVREALEAQTRSQVQQPEPEDDLDLRIFSEPKKVLKDLKEEAKREALQIIQAEQHKEKIWDEFLAEYPDIRRRDAERVLHENMSTIGAMTDIIAAKRIIAQKVRAEYAEIANLMKPRTNLGSKKQVLSPSGGSKSVTPVKKESGPLSFSQQMRKLRGT